MSVPGRNPALLVDYDETWATRAAELLSDLRGAISDLPGFGSATLEHIGSTSVPGLAAKPYLDLQLRILPLPSHEQLTGRLSQIGFERASGSRPDSPGVTHDIPRGDVAVPDAVWHKRLYVEPSRSAILHVRRDDSPWADHASWFRDWLRAHPAERDRYEAVKRGLAEQNAGKPDYDDYTRAKTAYFDEVQPLVTKWARRLTPPR